jgi:VCBS repeat protein
MKNATIAASGRVALALGLTALTGLAAAAPAGASIRFGTATTFTEPNSLAGVAVADFNGDGRPDLTVSQFSNGVAVLLNTTPAGATTPAFTTPTIFTAGTQSNSVAVGDFTVTASPTWPSPM